MFRLSEKKLKRAINVGSVLHTSATCGRLYVCIQSTRIYLHYIIFASHVTFSFKSSIFALFSSLTMALRKKCVRTLHDRLEIIQEVEKNPGEKRVDIAEWLGLPTSTLNSIFAKKNDICEQIQKCGNACKKRKTGKESPFAELENITKTDSLCYYVLIVMEVTNKCRLWSGNPRNQGASRMLKKLPIKYHVNSKAWMTKEIFCSFLHSLEKVKAFFYAHSVTDADRENILSLEKSYFQFRQNSAKKQKTMYDFFC
jgi:hypothetical protein